MYCLLNCSFHLFPCNVSPFKIFADGKWLTHTEWTWTCWRANWDSLGLSRLLNYMTFNNVSFVYLSFHSFVSKCVHCQVFTDWSVIMHVILFNLYFTCFPCKTVNRDIFAAINISVFSTQKFFAEISFHSFWSIPIWYNSVDFVVRFL